MQHIRFHDLKHFAATNMHQQSGDFYTIGQILGHISLKGVEIQLGISWNLLQNVYRCENGPKTASAGKLSYVLGE